MVLNAEVKHCQFSARRWPGHHRQFNGNMKRNLCWVLNVLAAKGVCLCKCVSEMNPLWQAAGTSSRESIKTVIIRLYFCVNHNINLLDARNRPVVDRLAVPTGQWTHTEMKMKCKHSSRTLAEMTSSSPIYPRGASASKNKNKKSKQDLCQRPTYENLWLAERRACIESGVHRMYFAAQHSNVQCTNTIFSFSSSFVRFYFYSLPLNWLIFRHRSSQSITHAYTHTHCHTQKHTHTHNVHTSPCDV